jgi:hypothetical protein
VFKRRQSFYDAMKQQGHLENGRMPQSLRDAFNIEAARQARTPARRIVRTRSPGRPSITSPGSRSTRTSCSSHGQIDRAEAHQMLGGRTARARRRGAQGRTAGTCQTRYYQADNGFLTLINESKKYLEQHGAKNLG